ncbi:MAG: tRNA (guanosine(46)-N7)-methyltransferase TrmB [Hyphomicrobium sp.]
MNTDDVHHELRSFGRRRGRKPSDRQADLLRTVLPRVAVDVGMPLAGMTPPRVSIEIGFGGGEHLLWQAAHNPDMLHIGCEPFEDGVIKVVDHIERQATSNIRIHMGDARDVLRALPAASIDRACILFPDPWPKKKHQKRRLVNAATLELLARVVKPGGDVRFATDIGDYVRSALEAFRATPAFVWQAESPADWRIRPADWPKTRYERKAEREGRQRYYFRFRRRADAM